jgi:SOS-response transcriptional repressor LexA
MVNGMTLPATILSTMTAATMTYLPLSEILNRLMFQQRVRVTELARRTGISQPTLQRMVAGTVENPHQASLKPLADYFQVTIEQLKGLEPISWLQPTTPAETGWTQVPLLAWNQAASWANEGVAETQQELLFTDAKIGQKAFAVRMGDASMEPLFPKGTLLFIDPEKIPKDRSYIVVALKDYPEAIFRQLIIDGPNRYLKPISPDFDRYKMSLLGEGDKIIGVLAQARRDYEE